jgi:hypothetical protein
MLDHLRTHTTQFFTRQALARLISTLICSVVVVVRPFSRLGGESQPYGMVNYDSANRTPIPGSNAFLILTIKELVFSAQADLAQHLEATVLNIAGALCGIGFSALGMFLSSLLGEESPSCRALQASCLVIIVFTGKWTRL